MLAARLGFFNIVKFGTHANGLSIGSYSCIFTYTKKDNIKSDGNNKLMRKIIFSRVNNIGYEAYINERKICQAMRHMKLRLKNTFSQYLYLFIIIETFSQYLGKHIQWKIQVNECKFSESYETIQ